MPGNDTQTPGLLLAWPFIVVLLVVAVDVLAGPEVGFLPLLSLGPAFAGVGGTRRVVVAAGVLALALCLLLGAYDGIGIRRILIAAFSVVGVTLAGVVAANLRQRRERLLANVRSIAEAAQRVLLRPVPRRAGDLQVAVSYTSAVAEARIGGDLYEVVPSPRGVRFIVGDVQGKGLEAVETAAVVLGAFREAAPEEPNLVTVGGRLEKSLDRYLSGEEFVTAVLVEVDSDRTVTMLNYGHPAPLLVRACGSVEFAEPPEPAPPLGLAALGPAGPQPFAAVLAPGDRMLLYTDGASEARDREGRFYPLAERAFLLREDDPEAALEALRADLLAHTQGPPHDDAALLLLLRRDEAQSPRRD